MILYDENRRFAFSDFGIEIPVRDSRSSRTFRYLADHPVLGPLRHRWHRRPGTETVSREDLLRVHTPEYVSRLFSDQLEEELLSIYELVGVDGRYNRYRPETAKFPLRGLFEQILERAGGTIACGRLALENGFCFVFGGGMHHAHAGYGSGFCPVNDIVVAVRKLQAEQRIRSAWIIDIDAHKGDGTADLTQDDPSITTLSIHMASGWPLDGDPVKADGRPSDAFVPSDIDIPIAAGEEERYLPELAKGLDQLASRSSTELAVVVSGADPYVQDELPSTHPLQLTLSQMAARDRLVYRFLQDQRIPAAYLMAGGYGERSWEVYAQFLEWVLMERFQGSEKAP
ncbi:MAG: histone deacetylase [Desulfobacteraceae bacterium]|jgi:acetoin utilization deacetylase AcuC-like enzyme|nr:histone deacetylase [Desulfobacteraceae bacterium]